MAVRLTHTELHTGLCVHQGPPGAHRGVSAHKSPSRGLCTSTLPGSEGTPFLEPGLDPGNLPTLSPHFKQNPTSYSPAEPAKPVTLLGGGTRGTCLTGNVYCEDTHGVQW